MLYLILSVNVASGGAVNHQRLNASIEK